MNQIFGAGDPIAALILCGAHRADRVMISGEWRVLDGQIVGFEPNRLPAINAIWRAP